MMKFLRLTAFVLVFFSVSKSWSQITFFDPFTGAATTSYILDTICQGQSIDHCFNVTGGTNHTITSFVNSDGTIIIAPPSNPFPRCFRYTASFSFTGSDAITFTVTNNLSQTATCTVTIVVVNPNAPVNAGPDQQLCSPTNFTTLTAVTPDPLSTGYWTKLTGPGVISGGFDSPAIAGVDQQGGPTINVSNLQLGSNIFIWHQDYPCDQNLDVVTVYVYNGTPPVADANICFPSLLDNSEDSLFLCGTNSYTLCANNPGTAATGTWSIFCGSGTIFNINNPNAPITNLGNGCNCLEWNIGNGPCPGGETKDSLFICVFPSIQTAIAPADVTRCLGSFSTVTLAGNALSGANTALWTFVSGPVTPTINPATTSTTTISNMTVAGVYTFNYRITSGPCGFTQDQVSISVYDPATPINAGLDQSICSGNSTTMAATPPTNPAIGTWSVISGSGSFASPNSPTSSVSGLASGLNVFRWTVANGNCANNNTFDQVNVTVYPANQPTPNAGVDQLLCYNGTPLSTSVTGTAPVTPGVGQWTISPATATVSPSTSPTATVSNLTPGVYTLTWTLSNGSCDPAVSDQMVITVNNGLLTTTNAGPDQNFCTPTTSATMAATVPSLPAIGTWSIIAGGGSIQSLNSANTLITNIPAGVNTYRWTINNGACGTFFDDITVNIYSNNATTANAGPDQEFCASGGAIVVTMAATPVSLPTVGTWSGPGTITSPNSATTTVTGLPIGTHNFTWTVNNGPCGSTSDVVQIRIYGPGQTAANATASAVEVCSNAPTVTLTGNSLVNPASGTWTIIQGGGILGSPNSQVSTISGMPVGTTCIEWRIYNGPCATPTILRDTVCINVFDISQTNANAGPDINECSDATSIVLVANNVIFPAVGTWSITPAGPLFTNANNPTTTLSNITPGTTYTLTWTIDNGACSTTSDQLTLNYYNNAQTPASAGPDQSICTPANSVTLGANAADSPATGVWTLISGPNTPTFTSNNPTTSLSNLIVGTYVMRWTINNGDCSPSETFDEVTIFVYPAGQTTANAGTDIEVCEPVTIVTLTGNALISPATGFWTQISGPNSATINNPNLAQVDVSNLIVGCYVFRWTINNSACVPPTTFDEIQVCVFDDSQTNANAGPDQIVCTPSSSATLAANAIISPAVGTWTFTGPNTPTFTPNINSPTATISGLVVGTYTLTWTVDNGACFNGLTTDQMIIEVFNSSDEAANAGPDQAICSPDDAVFMTANQPDGPAQGTWTLVSGGGTIVNLNDPFTEITNLPVGTNCFQWSTDNGGCGLGVTFDQVCIDVFSDNQLPANAGEDQDLCTPTSSTFLEGNDLILPATGQWTQIGGPVTVNFINPGDPNSEVTGMTDVGCYQFQWQINNGICANPITSDIVEVCVFNSGFDPSDAGPDQELCSPSTSTQMAAVPAQAPGEGTWTADPGNPTVASFSNINDPFATVSNLGIGEYHFFWALNYAACGSEDDEVVITIFNSAQGAAVAGPDQQLCTPTSNAQLAADAVLPPGYGTWSVVTGAVDFVNDDVNDPQAGIFNIAQGINTLVWTVYNGNCLAPELTTDTIVIYLNDVNQPAAFAGEDQSLCTPQTSTTLVGTDLIIPATGEWTTTSGATIVSPNSATTDIINLSVGISTFCWTIENGVCTPPTTSDCMDVYLYDENQEPANAGPDQELCSNLTDCAILDGNELTIPAIGTWSVIGGPSALVFSNPNDPNTEVCGLIPGVYTLEYCIDNGPCGEPTCDQMTITMFSDEAEPSTVGPDIEQCTPNQSVFMNANVVPLPGFGIWAVVVGGGIIDDNDNPQTEITEIPIGENQYSWCISNGVCPDANSCDTLSVFIFDENASPADAGPDQDWCEPVSCVTMAAITPDVPGVGTWTSLTAGPIITNVNDPLTEICNLEVGEYTFQWSVYNGPCANTNTTDLITIRIFPEAQLPANAGSDIEICTPQDIVNLDGNPATFPAVGTWNFTTGSTGTIVSANDPQTQVIQIALDDDGLSCYKWTIDNGPCIPSITTDTMCVKVYNGDLPAANAGENQELCAPFDLSPVASTLTGSALEGAATGSWVQVDGPGTATIANPDSPTTDISDLVVGCYIFSWTLSNGPCGTTTDEVQVCIFNPNEPLADAGPDGEFCTPIDCHLLNAVDPVYPAVGTWQPITFGLQYDNLNDPNEEFCGIPVGINIFIWNVDNGACGQSSDVLTCSIYDEFNPNANAGDDIEICLPQTETNLGAELPFLPATGQWEWISGPCEADILIAQVNTPTSLITGLCQGTTCFKWTVDNGPCPNGITIDTVCVRVYGPEPVVLAGPDQEICTPLVDVTMDGSIPQDPNVGTWILYQGGGTIEEPNNPATVISNMPVGINCFIWQYYNGNCVNNLPSDTVCISVFDESQPPADAGDDIELCFPDDFATMAANEVITPAIGYWTQTCGSGTIVDIFSPTTEVTDLSEGENCFVWTIDNGPCENAITMDTMIIHVFPENPQGAFAGPDQFLCTPESDVNLGATPPVLPSTAFWLPVSVNGILGNNLDANSLLYNLTVGIHTLEWHVYNGPCDPDAIDEVSIFVYDATAPLADAGEDMEICFPLDSVQMNGSIVTFPGTGMWTLGDHPGSPSVVNAADSATWVTDLEIGITELIWTIDNGDCGTTTDTVFVFVYDPSSPDAQVPQDQEICGIPQSVDLTGSTPIEPAYGWWEQIAGDNVTVIADSTSSSTTASGLALNETAFVWHIYNGPCDNGTTSDTIWFYISDPDVSAAYAGKDTTFCGAQDLLQLQGSNLVGSIAGLATGEWESLDTNGGNIISPNDPNTIVEDVPVGVHCYTWTVDNNACGITSDSVCFTMYDPTQPVAEAGLAQEFCQSEFETFTLGANEAIYPAVGYWTVMSGEIALDDSTLYNATVTTLGSISTPLVNEENWLVWTVNNGDCGTSTDSVLYVLLDCETIKIPDAFSPNGDGTNDVFYIPNLQYYPNNNIQIFNRWGALVYQSAPYNNDWDGTDTNPAALGTELPTATYYYVLDLGEAYAQPDSGNAVSVFTGYVYLKR
ncbi:MAG: PKD domain-containing protein [Flavobacteriales bacterium]